MVGSGNCVGALYDGLSRLEYRGYDSAGISTLMDGEILTIRRVGKLRELGSVLKSHPMGGRTGIGHTRWATHGVPSEANAHPHRYGRTVVVHNGIIENYRALREQLRQGGHEFTSQTDSEVLAHLVEDELKKGQDFLSAVRSALLLVQGSYALAIMNASNPDMLVAARQKSPLVIGLGNGENMVASDVPAFLDRTRSFLFLEDGEIAEISPTGVKIMEIASRSPVHRPATTIQWTSAMAEKGGYRHFMLKEIHEQPQRVEDTFRANLDPQTGEVVARELGALKRGKAYLRKVTIVACGTSYHAGLLGRAYIEKLSGVPCDVEIASEYRYAGPIVEKGQLVIPVSQSGETADTLAAAEEAKKRGAVLLALCNTLGSSLTRMADATLLTLAGPEIGVASTKAFTCQAAALYVIALWLAKQKAFLSDEELSRRGREAFLMPALMAQVLADAPRYEQAAQKYIRASSMLYLGRGLAYPIALEGALKLKELSYIHAEGHAAGEMKHGPSALVDEAVPSLFVAPEGPGFDKIFSNIQEIRARCGPVLAVTTNGNGKLSDAADDLFFIPDGPQDLRPLLTVLPLQLFAYYVANLKRCDVDQPRNLAKSVTVE